VFTAILLLIMSPAGTASRIQSSQMNAVPASNIPTFADDSPAELAASEERDFILRLNGLSKALTTFVETYKSGRIDLKEVKALRKAMHELEKSEWFTPPKAK
jgi:hypothetical protein